MMMKVGKDGYRTVCANRSRVKKVVKVYRAGILIRT